jgi:hypothetical protein
MDRSLADLEAIVRTKICGVCSDRTIDGQCGLEDSSACALFALFPLVAKAIQSTDSVDIRDYIQAIRSQVCSVCVNQAQDGSCETRRQVQCALDAYLVLIVEAIEEATGGKFDRSGLDSQRAAIGMSPNPFTQL